MLRVRDSAGRESSYESSTQLAAALASGVVRSGFEVFHTEAELWLPVETHPAYETFLASLAETVPAGVPPQPRPAASVPAPTLPANAHATASRASKLRAMLALAMGLGVLGLGLSFGPRIRGDRPEIMASIRDTAPTPVPDTWGSTPRPSAPLPIDAPPAGAPLAPPSGALVTRLGASRNGIQPSYREAYAEAQQEFLEGLQAVAFDRVFAVSRLTGPDSLRATGRRLRAAENLLRSYRGQEVLLEQGRQPGGADSATTLRERFEAAEAARQLLGTATALAAVLEDQESRLTITLEGVQFDDPRAAVRYRGLREALIADLATWRDSTRAPDHFTVPRLVAALSAPPPPSLRD